MKTMQQAAADSGIPETLVRAVVRQLGGWNEDTRQKLRDIASHSIDGGFKGFVYHSDTVPFFKRNREAILELAERMAEGLGEEPLTMVAGFHCLQPADRETKASIARCLYGGWITKEDTQVANALAWFAGEEVARAFEE